MSVAAYRQWCGATGKVDECQGAVDLYAAPGQRRNAGQTTWPLGMRLYVPKGWLQGPEYALAREGARLPSGIRFRTKHEIALDLIDRARALPHAAIVGAAGYGDNMEFRRALRDRLEPNVLGVSPSQLRVIDAGVPIAPPRANGRPRRPETHPTHAAQAKRESPGGSRDASPIGSHRVERGHEGTPRQPLLARPRAGRRRRQGAPVRHG